MTVRCVTFDLDDTLWECGPILLAAEEAFYDWISRHYAPIAERYSLVELVSHRREFFQRFPEMEHDLTGLRRRWLHHLAESFGFGPELVDPAFRVFWEHRNAVTLFEEAHALLDGMRERYAVGAITNGNADVHHIGIGHYFDFVITAAEAGAAKPQPEIFHAALSAAGVDAHQAVHVGDDPKRDVHGAKAVGMRTVWINVDGKPWPGGASPDAEIRTLDQLEPVLDAWRET
ncbi:MAG: HAD-IA family hydrolase [Gammaproteobacteria bacterium]|nr:HAD-IA family hydrolase [Gammaproteobacteria bacterium]NIM72215.1 HAD-IA family hydrolase [Gammaproteobacteria bacterium]NIN39130.1 HAD-IA family hydrolase [Gammaproteobacteria bacterium]NIO23963.1 HAD-IA family hydrolase [Gammaproteobacteria bacterium]NIO64615.1 HAD-IA family hydrolase [Gammaproteobacteria bacterium]